MQVIVKMRCRLEEYAKGELHAQVRPPRLCPRCTKRNSLKPHGYYDRGVTNTEGHISEIKVRRFECQYCGVTVSCLPSFAQPYRLVNNHTIQNFFNGKIHGIDVRRNEELLKCYWRRFERWAPSLRKFIGSAFSRAPPREKARALWQRLMAACKSLTDCTCRLVREFRTTCFGTYQCHQPRPAH